MNVSTKKIYLITSTTVGDAKHGYEKQIFEKLQNTFPQAKKISIDDFFNHQRYNVKNALYFIFAQGGKKAASMGALIRNKEFESDICFIDHSLFGGDSRGRFFRFSLNTLNPTVNYTHHVNSKKLQRIGINTQRLKPLQEKSDTRKHILILPPGGSICSFYDVTARNWANEVQRMLKVPQWEVIIKERNSKDAPPIQEYLNAAYLVIAYNSTVAIEALRQGIPAIGSTNHCLPHNTENHLDYGSNEDKLIETSPEYLRYFHFEDTVGNAHNWVPPKNIKDYRIPYFAWLSKWHLSLDEMGSTQNIEDALKISLYTPT